ncbi:MAG: transposase [Nannocystaceae bacterium]|nr:transposase [Nannocystaceae bacterium]
MRVSAAHRRLPQVAVRHWVLVPPPRWARALPREPIVARSFRRAVVQRVVAAIERRACRELGHDRGKAGAMAVLHSVGSDLRPRAHIHVIATDGVFVAAAHGPASFVPLLAPFEAGELRELARIVRSEASKAVRDPAPTPRPTPGVRVAGERPASRPRGTVAKVRGAEVFMGSRIEAHDRRGSESLTAYVLRSPLHPSSVRAVEKDVVELRLRDPAPDGAVAVQLPKSAFEARVRAMVEGEAARLG